MTVKQKSHRADLAVIAGAAFLIPFAAAFAQINFTAPAGYLPGWQVSVAKSGGDLTQPAGAAAGGFIAPASTFDMGSYHGAVLSRIEGGVDYDAQGLLNLDKDGPYRIGATVSWTAGDAGPEPICAVSLSVEGNRLADWKGPIAVAGGHQLAQGNADLKSGLHPIRIHAACDQAVGARVSFAVALKSPSDADLRPMGPVDIVHAGSGAQIASAPPAEPSPPGAAPAASGPAAAIPPAPPPPAAAPPPAAGVPSPDGSGGTLVATIDLGIRENPSRTSRKIGRLRVGQVVTIGPPPADPAWVALADGGYVESAYLAPPDRRGRHALSASR